MMEVGRHIIHKREKRGGPVEVFGIRQMVRCAHFRLDFHSLKDTGFNIQHGVICCPDVFWIVFLSSHVEFNPFSLVCA